MASWGQSEGGNDRFDHNDDEEDGVSRELQDSLHPSLHPKQRHHWVQNCTGDDVDEMMLFCNFWGHMASLLALLPQLWLMLMAFPLFLALLLMPWSPLLPQQSYLLV